MSDTLKIITNNVPRDILWDLPESDRKEFDYIKWSDVDNGIESVAFVNYKGQLYDLNDTEGVFPADRSWFYVSDSFFSGVLFRYPADEFGTYDTEQIICGRYYA
jgi:hypothetical protein